MIHTPHTPAAVAPWALCVTRRLRLCAVLHHPLLPSFNTLTPGNKNRFMAELGLMRKPTF